MKCYFRPGHAGDASPVSALNVTPDLGMLVTPFLYLAGARPDLVWCLCSMLVTHHLRSLPQQSRCCPAGPSASPPAVLFWLCLP